MPVDLHPPDSNDLLVVFLPGERDDAWIERVKAKNRGLQIKWIPGTKPDGSFVMPNEIDPSEWDGATILSAAFAPPVGNKLEKVRFIQLASAGADFWIKSDIYKNKDVTICTANGVHAPQITEWVMGAWLSHTHHFQEQRKLMEIGSSDKLWHLGVQDGTSSRIGVLGYGAIGRQCARVAKAMGMDVYAFTRSEKSTPEKRKDDSYCVPGTGDPDGLLPSRWFHGSTREAVNEFLAQDLDLLVISLPLTPETHHILSKEQFEILSKRKTFVANIARGGHIDQPALINALETGQIRGAALDVTDPEPLPSDDPLWKAPNIFVTSHVSWKSNVLIPRVLDLVEYNLGRLADGKQPINVMNRELNY